jgi:2'-hydroxyisoflavone reductase
VGGSSRRRSSARPIDTTCEFFFATAYVADMNLLVFGGTGFVGPHLVRAALAAGHAVTVFNRGNKPQPAGAEVIVGDRDPATPGLDGLAGRTFDIVYDNCGYYPRIVAGAAQRLAPVARGYVYISSIAAYAGFGPDEVNESSPVASLADPDNETMGEQFSRYGALKAACEAAVRAAFGPRCCIVRPGYIVGPGDHTDRFTTWPVRFARGGTVEVPGTPDDPFQVIDVRDLASFLVHLGETGASGDIDAVGPTRRWGEVIAACEAAGTATALWRTPSLPAPIWAEPSGDTRGVHTLPGERARAAGLRCRPIAETVRDTAAWFASLPAERREKLV